MNSEQKTNSDTKTRLLQAADELFYRQGFHKTGINQIIDTAQTAKASFYAHFPSKKDLGIAYLEQRHQTWFALLKNHLNVYENPRKKILGLFEFLAEWMEKTNYRGCAFINMNSEITDEDEKMRQIIQKHKKELRLFVRNLTEELAASEPMTGFNEELLSDTLYILFEGALVECQNHRETWPAECARKVANQMV